MLVSHMSAFPMIGKAHVIASRYADVYSFLVPVAQDAEQRASDAEDEQLRAEQEAAGLAAELRSLQASSAGQHAGENGDGARNDGGRDDGGDSMVNYAQVLRHDWYAAAHVTGVPACWISNVVPVRKCAGACRSSAL